MKSISEIEGLRAIAVMVVVLFHSQFRFFSGGYIGVDVFFVISGYLITGLLWRELQTKKTISLTHFFSRRILRLAPALAVTSLCIAFIFSILLPPVVTSTLTRSLISAQFSFSNFWFYFNTNYFASNATNPALHTWSLAVEEQFYLSLPILLLFFAQWSRRRVLTVFFLLAGFSFLASCWIVLQKPSQAFYLPWLRAWELLVGSLLAVSSTKVRHPVAAPGLTVVGIAAIAFSCLTYTEKTQFPGPMALIPVLGTALVIVTAGHDNFFNKLLGLAPLKWLGKISYSVYLVHWPIVCAVSLTISLFPAVARYSIVVTSLALGWASWKWIETPLRSKANIWSPRKVILGFLVVNIFVCFGILGIRFGGQMVWAQFPKASAISNYLEGDPTLFKTGSCFLDASVETDHQFDRNACLHTRDSARNALILGDSHAANLWTALTELQPQINFMHATAVGCRPLLDATFGAPVCLALNHYIFRDWLVNSGKNVDLVILAGRWELSEIHALKQTVAYLASLGKKTIVVGPTPEYFVTVPLMLAYEEITGFSLQHRMIRRDRIELDRTLSDGLRGTEAAYFSMTNELCRGQDHELVCLTRTNDVPMWSDRDHFTAEGAKFVVSKIPMK